MSEDAPTPDPRHRVAAFVGSAHSDLDDLTEVSVWSMTPQETAPTLLALTRLKARIAELELRVAGHANAQIADAANVEGGGGSEVALGESDVGQCQLKVAGGVDLLSL